MTSRFPYVQNPLILAFLLLALLLVPTPLLPPHRLAEFVRSSLGVGWKAAYLASTMGLVGLFYFAVGVAAVLAVGRAETRRNRFLQIGLLPVAIVCIVLFVHLVSVGHFPMFANAVVPLVACLLGVWMGLAFLFRRIAWNLVGVCVLLGGTLWLLTANVSTDLARLTEEKLKSIGKSGPALPTGDERFGAILRIAFESAGEDAILENRAAILAVGIAVGHDRLAKYVGLDRNSEPVKAAVNAAIGASIRKRQDWAKHFSVSAALAVLESPLVSDVGGLIKEELDAYAQGSGFSFGDLAADRAGIRFAEAATRSDVSAKVVRERMKLGFDADDYLPAIEDLPENMTGEQFQARFGGAGSAAFRKVDNEIDARLDNCAGLK